MQKIDYKTYQKPSHFISFKQGENRFRIISDGYMGYEHGTKVGNRYMWLGKCTQNNGCEHCKKGNQPKLKYKWIVYDPSLQGLGVRVLVFGPRNGDKLCQMFRSDDPKLCDTIANRDGFKLNTSYTFDRANLTRINTKLMPLIEQARDYLLRKYVL